MRSGKRLDQDSSQRRRRGRRGTLRRGSCRPCGAGSLNTDQGNSDPKREEIGTMVFTSRLNPSIQIRAIPTMPCNVSVQERHPIVSIPQYRSGLSRGRGDARGWRRVGAQVSILNTDQGSSDLAVISGLTNQGYKSQSLNAIRQYEQPLVSIPQYRSGQFRLALANQALRHLVWVTSGKWGAFLLPESRIVLANARSGALSEDPWH